MNVFRRSGQIASRMKCARAGDQQADDRPPEGPIEEILAPTLLPDGPSTRDPPWTAPDSRSACRLQSSAVHGETLGPASPRPGGCASTANGVARAKSALASGRFRTKLRSCATSRSVPVSLASEVIAERWTPLILREIVLFDRHHFSEIQHGVGRISQSLLSARLRTLEAAGVIERRPNRLGRGWEYHPTRAGRELETVLNELGIWAQHWIELRQEDCDPAYLMQTVHAVLRLDRLPRTPLTVRFEFTEHPKIYWLVLGGEQPELCYYDPGRDVGTRRHGRRAGTRRRAARAAPVRRSGGPGRHPVRRPACAGAGLPDLAGPDAVRQVRAAGRR